jgi:septum formation protein
MASTPERVVLASASTARAALLRAAGIDFAIEPADIDETGLKDDSRRAGGSAIDCAAALAWAKAVHVSNRDRKALVIGGDQLLAMGSQWFDKPRDLSEAADHLRILRGQTHELATAVCVVHRGQPLWRATSVPEMTMRWFSDAFLERYIAAEGKALLGSVGAYRLEGKGVQLFSRINGDHFAVLGLPLIELLGFLRQRGALPE